MSLRARIVALIGVVLLVSVLLGALVAGLEARRTLREELTAALAGGAQTVRSAYEDLPRSDHPARDLRQLVGTFNGNRHLRARLVDRSGAVLAVSEAPSVLEPAPSWFGALLRRPPGPMTLAAPRAGGAAISLEPIAAPDVAAAWREVLRAVAIIAATALLGLLLVFVAIGAAVRPLQRMSAALARIGEGDYDARVPEEGPPELVQLQRAFNRMGEQLAAMEARNRMLENQLVTIQDEERAEIARDLHDDMGPHLFSVTIDAQIIAGLANGPAEQVVRDRLRAIQEAVTHMQRLVRDLLGRLRPTPVTELGLAPAIDDLVRFWQVRRGEVRIELELTDEAQLSEPLKEVAFRVVQEALNNAMRHANPKLVQVSIRPLGETEVEVAVANDGSVNLSPNGGGFGLIGLRERVQALGGRLRIDKDSTDAGGWTIAARLPLKASAPGAQIGEPA